MMEQWNPRISVVEIQDFLSKNSHVGINDVDGEGRTILMNACKLQREDVVQFILDKGADPNKKCKELNTALHFACHVEDVHSARLPYLLGSGSDHGALHSLRLVEMLLTHGATVQRNIHGWSPACYAAIAKFHCTVEHFIHDPRWALSASDKIEIVELLVFRFSVMQKDSKLARKYLSKVLSLCLENGLQIQRHAPFQLEECLEKMGYTKPGDLTGIIEYPNLELQGILIGYRVLPQVFRDIFLWKNLFTISVNISYHHFFRVCDALLKLEMDGTITVGTVLFEILHKIRVLDSRVKSFNEKRFNQIFTYLKSYKDVLRSSSHKSIVRNLEKIHNYLGHFLNVVIHTTGRKGVEMCIPHLHSIAELAGVVTEVSTRYNIDITQPLMFKENEKVIGYFRGRHYFFHVLEKEMFKMVMLTYSQLLHHENPSHQCKQRGETILHQIVNWLNAGLKKKTQNSIGLRSISVGDFVDLVLPVVRKTIRHGCCVAIRDRKGRTALDIVKSVECYFAEDPVSSAKYKALLKVLKNVPTKVSLQELAARVIVQTKIPYHAKLPTTLSNFIED